MWMTPPPPPVEMPSMTVLIDEAALARMGYRLQLPTQWRLCPAPPRPYPRPEPEPPVSKRKAKGFAHTMGRILIAGLVARSGGSVDPAWFGGPPAKGGSR